MPTRMLGVSVFSPAISLARSALVEKARAAVERTAAVANGRLTASRIAIGCGCGGVDAVGGCVCVWVGVEVCEAVAKPSMILIPDLLQCSALHSRPVHDLADSLLHLHLSPLRALPHPVLPPK